MVFRHTLNTWRTTWCIGIFLSILSLLFNKPIFYIYYYFFFVGLISLLNYLQKYIYLNNNGLTLYYNSLSSIFIKWNDIKSMTKTMHQKDNIKTAGGRVRFTINQKKEFETIALDLSKPIDKEIKNSNIQITENGYKLILLQPPEEGVECLLLCINGYLNKNLKALSQHKKCNAIAYLNISILILSLILILININKFILN